MRYALLSDIHGNLHALTAVMEMLASERVDRYLCLGDIVGYGAHPVECLARMRGLDAVTVVGNHDAACVGKLDLSWFHDAGRAALLWTRDRLSLTDLEWLRRLPLTESVEPFTLVHASLRQPERFAYLLDLEQVIETLHLCRTPICLAGHTHLPWVVAYDRAIGQVVRVVTASEALVDVPLEEDPARRYFINPGSVGQPRDGDPRASVALIDTGQRRVSIRRVPYDIHGAAQAIRQAGLPAFLADRLAIGR